MARMANATSLLRRFLLIAALSFSPIPAWAQDVYPSTADLQARGIDPATLTPDKTRQLEQKMRDRGYSQEQIDAAKAHYGVGSEAGLETSVTATGPKSTVYTTPDDTTATQNPDSSTEDRRPEKAVASDKNDRSLTGLRYFGYDLFRTLPDAFKPNAVGPVDPGYLVGPGDALRLAVWGQVELQYELTVNNEGKIFIPVVGQVYVSGVPFDQLQNKIKNLLGKYYSGLTGPSPRTSMDLTVAKLRPVRIFVMGEVARPGGYTISSYANVFNALYSIGGPGTQGSLRSIAVQREGKKIATVDVYDYLLAGACSTDVRLQNNDVIYIPKRGKTAAIGGAVFRPAIYELRDKDNLQALLGYAGNVKTKANVDRAQIYRVLPYAQRTPERPVYEVIDIDLKQYLDNKKDLELADQDSVVVVPLREDLRNFALLTGAVQYPGLYQCDTLTLKKLIFDQGRIIANQAYVKRADLIRVNQDLVTTTTIPVNLTRLFTDPSYDRPLQAGDEIIVYEMAVEKPTDLLITVEGEARMPGTYPLSIGMSVQDALLRAGGLTRRALRNHVDVYRPDRIQGDTLMKVFKVDLPDSMDYAEPAALPFILQDRDRIVVRPDPEYTEGDYVEVKGLVRYAGKFAVSKRNERATEILDRAGGLLPDAFLLGANLTRNGQRVVINFEKAYLKHKRIEDVIVHPGDVITIPPKPNTVVVKGQVNNAGLFGYVDGQHVGDYVDRAGGRADSVQSILLTKPNGETRKAGRHTFLRNPKVPDGSLILVTKKKPRPREERKGPTIAEVVRDTLAIVTSAVTIIVLVATLRKG